MKTTARSKCATVVLLTLLVFIGGWATKPGAWAQASTWHVAVNGSDMTTVRSTPRKRRFLGKLKVRFWL